MSAITGDGAVGALGAASGVGSRERNSGGFGDVTSGEFMEIILSELSNQDPLAPNDSQALLEQISTIRSIESDTKLTDQLETLVDQNGFSQAAGLIGTTVSGRDERGGFAFGEVSSVLQTRDGASVVLNTGQRVPLGSISEILATPRPADDPGGDA